MNKNIYGYGNPYNPEALKDVKKINEDIEEAPGTQRKAAYEGYGPFKWHNERKNIPRHGSVVINKK